MLLVAVTCFITNKNNNYFFSKRKKKNMQVQQQWSGGCQGFLGKYYPQRSGGVEIFSKTRRAWPLL